MKAKDRMIDTCVFFEMLTYYKVYKMFGEEGVLGMIDAAQSNTADLANQIIVESGVESSEEFDLAFKTLKDKLIKEKNKLKNEHSQKENYAESLLNLILSEKLPEDVRIKRKERWAEIRNDACEKILTLCEETTIQKYLAQKRQLQAGQLFLKIVHGEINPHICATNLDEILSHTQPNAKHENWNIYDGAIVDGFIDNFVTLISTHSKSVVNELNNIVKVLRSSGDAKPGDNMQDPVNANGVYGDSLSVAWSLLSGIPYITFNQRDFIFNSKASNPNQSKRERNNRVAERLNLSNASAYTVKEELLGLVKEPTKLSSDYVLEEEGAENYSYNLANMHGETKVRKCKLINTKK